MISPRTDHLIDLALEEDAGLGDVTSRAIFAAKHRSSGFIDAKQNLVICGLAVAARVFARVDPALKVVVLAVDGDRVKRGARVLRVDGIWHIWRGYDHILFILTLLLPAVLQRDGGRWLPVASLRRAFLHTAAIVTAFTLAHSITLSLATLGVISLPSRLVESVIAASIIVAALNNLFPVVTRRLWLVAFTFGLVHGFGFASVLADLGLPKGSLLLALVGFNLGVETGQLAIVGAFLPIAFLLCGWRFYPRSVLQFGSAAVAGIAALWFIQRAFDIVLI